MGFLMIIVGIAFVIDAFSTQGFSYGMKFGYDRAPTHPISAAGRVIVVILGIVCIISGLSRIL